MIVIHDTSGRKQETARRHSSNTRGPAGSGAGRHFAQPTRYSTHIDALCHQACGLRLHGDIAVDEAETPAGFTRLGIETVPPLLRRGVLLDVPRWKGQDRLPLKYGINAEDLRGCAASQNVEVRSGDVLLVRTGYAPLWNDEATYLDAAGISKSGTLWAAERGVVTVGADNMAWDVPDERDPETGATLFAHVHLLTQKGIYIIENVNLEELSRDRCYTFAFIGIPLKLNGATGSPIRPLALV